MESIAQFVTHSMWQVLDAAGKAPTGLLAALAALAPGRGAIEADRVGAILGQGRLCRNLGYIFRDPSEKWADEAKRHSESSSFCQKMSQQQQRCRTSSPQCMGGMPAQHRRGDYGPCRPRTSKHSHAASQHPQTLPWHQLSFRGRAQVSCVI